MSTIKDFSLAVSPQLQFGNGKVSLLPSAAKRFGSKVLLVTGARSFITSEEGQTLQDRFRKEGLRVEIFSISGEPSPLVVDASVKQYSSFQPDCVVAIGGGSALDAGKAISAMLPLGEPVKDYLEGVGSRVHPGVKVPFIAVPTTSGTGSEATKNAVLSETGENGYKRSLRHDRFVPDLAIVDPALTLNCPGTTTAASGMDAFTQLLESYLSTASNPVTDALALQGLECISKYLLLAFHDGSNLKARAGMALAAYLSGITLANAGLGLVHGFSSSLGGFFNIPHGVICSTLMAPANRITVRKLRQQKTASESLTKYAIAGKLFCKDEGRSEDYYTDVLLSTIESFTQTMDIPKLSHFGVRPQDFDRITGATSNKNNPAPLDRGELYEVLEKA